jgi:hypothetical protein
VDGIADPAELGQLLAILDRQSPGDCQPSSHAAGGYARHRERMARKAKAESAEGRDIGPIPPVADPDRKAACRRDLKLYCETYYPRTFRDPWCPDHLRLIIKLQTAALAGIDQAFAMPRGTGKSVICERTVIWSTGYGHHLFVMLLCANEKLSEKSLIKIQAELEQNPLLLADFPEICYPIACLERIAQRAKGQTCLGQPTYLQWSGEQIILPVIAGSPASGAVICVAGLQEAIRGSSIYHPPTGGIIRPTLVIPDDPQTRDSARSEEERRKRLQIITSDLRGLAGPGESISIVVPCTVIEPGDVADELLDREKHPEFRGERCKLLYEFPKHLELWDEYDAVRRRCFKSADDRPIDDAAELFRECNEFYAAHRAKMDAGARVAWPERHKPHELSALQHAMNLYLTDPAMFYTEYQNDPQAALDQDDEVLTADQIAAQLSGLDRYRIPEGCQYVTAFIDVHKRVLYYALAAWTPHFDGWLIDYGTFPKQRQAHFTERTARPTLQEKYPGKGLEGALHAGIEQLANDLFSLKLTRDDGAKLAINLCLIDSGWKPDSIFRYCVQSPYETRVAPSLGRPIGPDEKQLSRCKPRKGEHIGQEWTIPAVHGRQVRQVQFDTYFWKSFFHRRLATAIGDRGSLSIFGQVRHGRPSDDHHFFAQHLTAEYSSPLTGRRTVDVWKMKPGHSQNHWFDAAVGCTVAASVLGSQIVGTADLAHRKQPRRKVSY